MTKSQLALVEAKEKGYYVINGEAFSKYGKLKLSTKNGYYCFGIRNKFNDKCSIRVHRLVAYQKYGNEIFTEGLEVRHLDSDKTNNKEENIVLGTHKQNMGDIPEHIRLQKAIHATSYAKKHDHVAILKRREEGINYKTIMEEFNISSKGTLSFIINKSYDRIPQ